MEFIKYSELTQVYRQQLIVPLRPNLNGYAVRNIGDTTVLVNNKRLLPPVAPGTSGESISIGGNLGELYTGLIEIKFEGGGTNPAVEVTQKYYVGNQLPETE